MNMLPSNQELNIKCAEFSKGDRQAEGVFWLFCQVKGFVWVIKNHAAILDAREKILEEWREKCQNTDSTSLEIIKAIVHTHIQNKTFKETIRAKYNKPCKKYRGSGKFCMSCDYGRTAHS